MIPLDSHAGTILPYGLKGTPFEIVYKALQSVAASVWDVDPAVYRAGIAWGWYLTRKPDVLAQVKRDLLVAALISEQAPLVKATQTPEDLVSLLSMWMEYRPTNARLEALYSAYSAVVSVLPITDEESQAILPVPVRSNAVYVAVREIDWEKPLSLEEAATIAERATPMGMRAYPYYAFENRIDVFAKCAYGDGIIVYVEDSPALPPVPEDGPYGIMTDDEDLNLRGVLFGTVGDHQALAGADLIPGEAPPYGTISLAVSATAYLRSSGYQNLNKSVSANSSNYLYESGSSASMYADSSKTYTLTGAYTAANVAVDTTGAYLYFVESGDLDSLRLMWGPTAANVCYITFTIE